MTRTLLAAIIVGISGLLAHAGQPVAPPAIYRADQAAGGQRELQVNAFGTCSDCHGATLTGRSGVVGELPLLDSLPEHLQKTIRDTHGGKIPPLAGPAFQARWGNRSTKALSWDLQRRFYVLSEETQLNIMAYILQLNGALPGTQPLTRDTDVEIGAVTSAALK
jgi:cytochrome c553